jgi:hypothetical protein
MGQAGRAVSALLERTIPREAFEDVHGVANEPHSLTPPLTQVHRHGAGLAAAHCDGCSVTLTDLPAVLPNLRYNVHLNAATVREHGGAARAAELDWTGEEAGEADAAPDVVIGADVGAAPVLHPCLVAPRHLGRSVLSRY